MLLYLIVAIVVGFLIYKILTKPRLQANEDFYEQHGVKVNFKEGTITIRNHRYTVNQVTGIKIIEPGSGKLTTRGVEIEVDDFEKPIHKITIGGFGNQQKMFAQRLSVALRKAGGPNFV
ncbi:MAG: hypothetical protein J0L66_11650 [Cytophagales bacterium]|nr:hypothetical protein [Cytophagales bacterium]